MPSKRGTRPAAASPGSIGTRSTSSRNATRMTQKKAVTAPMKRRSPRVWSASRRNATAPVMTRR